MAFIARTCRCFLVILLCLPLFAEAAKPVNSMVVFGDSLSDTGNTTKLLKSLRNEDNPAYLISPFKTFVLAKMVDFAEEYMVPQLILDAGMALASEYFDYELAPMVANLIGKIRLIPIIPDKPYWQHRFSNGRVWNEYLAPMLAVDREDMQIYSNKAFGGSWAVTYDYQLTVWNLIRHPIALIKSLIVGKFIPPSLGLTVQGYLFGDEAVQSDAVYFFFSGANDYLNVLTFEANYEAEVMSAYIDNVIDGIEYSINKMIKSGARQIVVIGLPDVGITPKFVNTMDSTILSDAIKTHNDRLLARVVQWQRSQPDVDYLYIDVQQFVDDALSNPEKYRLTHTRVPCIDVKLPVFKGLEGSPFANNYVLRHQQALQYKDASLGADYKNYEVCNDADGYLFWDEVHPTTRAHLHLAYEICKAMARHGYKANCQLPANA